MMGIAGKVILYGVWMLFGFKCLKTWQNQRVHLYPLMLGLVVFGFLEGARLFQMGRQLTIGLFSLKTYMLFTLITGWLQWTVMEFGMLEDLNEGSASRRIIGEISGWHWYSMSEGFSLFGADWRSRSWRFIGCFLMAITDWLYFKNI